jgi:hypothetical protein
MEINALAIPCLNIRIKISGSENKISNLALMEAVSPDLENKAFAVVFLIGNLADSRTKGTDENFCFCF